MNITPFPISALHGLGRNVLGVVCLALCTTAWTSEAPDPQTDLSARYAAIAPIQPVPQEGLQRLSLPLPVLQTSRSTAWADVRVLNAAGRPVPTAWLPAPTPARAPADADVTSATLPQFAWPSATGGNTNLPPEPAPLRVHIHSSGAVIRVDSSGPRAATPTHPTVPPRIWLLDLSALPRPGRPIQQLQLDWPAQPQGLNGRVDVEGSDDAQRWSRITAGPLLELPSSRPAAAVASDPAAPPTPTSPPAHTHTTAAPSVKHVNWPPGVAMPRYLRLSFEQPMALGSAQLRWTSPQTPAPLSSTNVQFQPVAADGKQPAHWALDLHGAVPIQRLQLSLPQVNTVLGLRLERRNDSREAWQHVTAFVAWRLQRDGSEQQSAAVEWRTTPTGMANPGVDAARYWRLIPDGRTAQLPAQPLNATIGWPSPQLLLVAQGGGALRLAVGKAGETSATVAWQTLVPGADEAALQRLPQAELGALTPQVVVEPTLHERLQAATPQDQRRWMLWGVLALAVLGLGSLAWTLGRDMKRHTP